MTKALLVSSPKLTDFVAEFSYTSVPLEEHKYDKKISRDDLSEDQTVALDAIYSLAKSGKPLVTLGGYAGTGKSTIIPVLSELLGKTSRTAFCAFTGKAADVLKRKLRAAGIHHPGFIGTIHSLMYEPLTNEHGMIVGWRRKKNLYSNENNCLIDSIIIDEASMLGSRLLNDLQSFDIPIIAVGDHGQLPPVQDTSVLDHIDFRLEQIHRHAADNKILQLATHIRQEGDLPKSRVSNEFVRYVMPDDVMETVGDTYDRLGMDMAVLVRRNAVRKNFNLLPREVSEPLVGDIVICLKNSPPIYNGMRGVLKSIEAWDPHWYKAEVYFPDNYLSVRGLLNLHQFGRDKTLDGPYDIPRYPGPLPMGLLFDFGLAMTVHKAQGSAFQEVVLCPEKWSSDTSDDYCKWLYTAVTRAVDKIHIVL
jgi:exodeoxyribonuclease-5